MQMWVDCHCISDLTWMETDLLVGAIFSTRYASTCFLSRFGKSLILKKGLKTTQNFNLSNIELLQEQKSDPVKLPPIMEGATVILSAKIQKIIASCQNARIPNEDPRSATRNTHSNLN
jgi:hypothetical protein